MEPQPARCVGSWVLEGELGRGSFAVVWRARHATTGAPAAVKEINTDKLNKKLQESLASEVAVLSQTKHRNIVGLLDLLKVRPPAVPGARHARRPSATRITRRARMQRPHPAPHARPACACGAPCLCSF